MKKLFYIGLVALMTISCKNSNKTADAYGNFESEEIIISSEQSGKILIMDHDEGDILKAGEIICQIDTFPLHLKLQTLYAQKNAVLSRGGNVSTQIEVLRQQKSNLTKELARIENLLKDGAATGKQKDDITYQISTLDRQISNAESQNNPIGAEANTFDTQIDQLKDQIKRSTIYSPIDASILGKYTSSGEIATIGKPLVKIANMQTMYLRAYVSGDQLSEIKTGAHVLVRIDAENSTYKELDGEITWISQQAEFTPKVIQTKKERVNLVYAIKIKVKNAGSLKIGMPGEVIFK